MEEGFSTEWDHEVIPDEKRRPNSPASTISIKPWTPDTPYLKTLNNAKSNEIFAVYMKQKEFFGTTPGFFLDCSDFFMEQNRPTLALQILSNIAELEFANAALLRILAHRLAQLKQFELSEIIFEEVLRMRPEEPQSYRDLALILAKQKKYSRAIELLYQIITKNWDRFDGIELTVLMEMNNIIAKAKKEGITKFKVDSRLIKLLDVDVRIVLTWDADMTDMDLWVIEPSGEKSFYEHRLTTIGGRMSCDYTQGYGPEEYLLKNGMKGKYSIKVNYFGNNAPTLTGRLLCK